MEKLKSFLVTRMLLILLAVLAAEGAVSLLVERVILPVILRLSGDGVTEHSQDVLAIAGYERPVPGTGGRSSEWIGGFPARP